MSIPRPLLVASIALTLAACAGRAPAPQAYSLTELTTANVMNAHPFPVTVYLVQPDLRHRLGVVESMTGEMFRVPAELLQGRLDFRLVAAPLGPHPTYLSETFMLQPGQSAHWRIQESPASGFLSLVSIR